MNITLRQLRYFVEIAQSGSFSQASKRLLIAQPALSQNISILEKELGVQLLVRRARGVELSLAGERLLVSAREILNRTDALGKDVLGQPGEPVGPVRVSISGSIAGVIVGPLLRAVSAQYPGIVLTVHEGLSLEVRAHV